MYFKIFKSAKEFLSYKIKCNICGKILTAKDTFCNKENICRYCINGNIAKDSKKRTLNAYWKGLK
jgi:hypothetical protein